ncbi:MAG: ATP synthase F1 subunit epsilon [Lachnospiraceae bacterium]|nr:ATP synthase F1 subunit epsilon [Lachnospiraceae bacterium]
MAEEKLFKLKVICPDRVFYEGEASMVELDTSEGQVGIYKEHIPMTMILVPGVLKITEAEGVKEAALHAGFIEVLPQEITILAEIAEWPDEIDVNRANEAKVRAERRLAAKDADLNIVRAETALKKSLIRLELGDK